MGESGREEKLCEKRDGVGGQKEKIEREERDYERERDETRETIQRERKRDETRVTRRQRERERAYAR